VAAGDSEVMLIGKVRSPEIEEIVECGLDHAKRVKGSRSTLAMSRPMPNLTVPGDLPNVCGRSRISQMAIGANLASPPPPPWTRVNAILTAKMQTESTNAPDTKAFTGPLCPRPIPRQSKIPSTSAHSGKNFFFANLGFARQQWLRQFPSRLRPACFPVDSLAIVPERCARLLWWALWLRTFHLRTDTTSSARSKTRGNGYGVTGRAVSRALGCLFNV